MQMQKTMKAAAVGGDGVVVFDDVASADKQDVAALQ